MGHVFEDDSGEFARAAEADVAETHEESDTVTVA
jgi:hypothetical protein